MGESRGRLISQADRLMAINLIDEACASGARKCKACATLHISIRTYERWVKADGLIDQRKNAKRIVANKLTKEERALVVSIANNEKYRDLAPCSIVPMLADEGRYVASESSFYRILRAEGQLTHRQTSQAAKHKRPRQCSANAPDQVWSWDITYLPSLISGQYHYLYMIIDIFSRKIVGFSVHETQSAEHASELVKQACIDEHIERSQLILHSDNGSPMKGATMLAMLEALGVMPSFSRPSVSDDNPFSESLFKTLKYHPTFPIASKFSTIRDARKWCIRFVDWYNYQHRHSGLKFITPQQRHCGEDKVIMANRHQVYQRAKLQQPNRWSGNTRNWILPDTINLNPNRKQFLSQKRNMEELAQAT